MKISINRESFFGKVARHLLELDAPEPSRLQHMGSGPYDVYLIGGSISASWYSTWVQFDPVRFTFSFGRGPTIATDVDPHLDQVVSWVRLNPGRVHFVLYGTKMSGEILRSLLPKAVLFPVQNCATGWASHRRNSGLSCSASLSETQYGQVRHRLRSPDSIHLLFKVKP